MLAPDESGANNLLARKNRRSFSSGVREYRFLLCVRVRSVERAMLFTARASCLSPGMENRLTT